MAAQALIEETRPGLPEGRSMHRQVRMATGLLLQGIASAGTTDSIILKPCTHPVMADQPSLEREMFEAEARDVEHVPVTESLDDEADRTVMVPDVDEIEPGREAVQVTAHDRRK